MAIAETLMCWCCAGPLMLNGQCPICDRAGLMSPPHVCLRTARVIGDEHGDECEPGFPTLPPDHENV